MEGYIFGFFKDGRLLGFRNSVVEMLESILLKLLDSRHSMVFSRKSEGRKKLWVIKIGHTLEEKKKK